MMGDNRIGMGLGCITAAIACGALNDGHDEVCPHHRHRDSSRSGFSANCSLRPA